MYQHKKDLIEELTKLLEEQDPEFRRPFYKLMSVIEGKG